jgi:hypothetical protein
MKAATRSLAQSGLFWLFLALNGTTLLPSVLGISSLNREGKRMAAREGKEM